MNQSKQLKKSFSSIEKCYIPLLNYEVKTCVKVWDKEFYTTLKILKRLVKNVKQDIKRPIIHYFIMFDLVY